MSSFTTTNLITFAVNITFKDVKNVQSFVKYPDGTPVKLLEAVETGNIAAICDDIVVLVDVMFCICLDQVKEQFDLTRYDEAHSKDYLLQPELKDEPPLTKASRWFGEQLDGDTLIQMSNAFQESIVNFIPNENRRTAMRAVLDKSRETVRLEAEYQIKLVDQMFEQTESSLKNRWNKIASQQRVNLERMLDGQPE